jgi:hypothetical protein
MMTFFIAIGLGWSDEKITAILVAETGLQKKKS